MISISNISDEFLGQTNNDKVKFHPLNLSDSNSVREFAAYIYKTETRLDILINNAGILLHPYFVEHLNSFQFIVGDMRKIL